MTDTVFVTGLTLHAYHGVMQHEAKVGQTFRLDLALDIGLAQCPLPRIFRGALRADPLRLRFLHRRERVRATAR